MKFMLILFNNAAAFGTMTAEQRLAAFGASIAINATLADEGKIASDDPLQPSFTARQVHALAGEID